MGPHTEDAIIVRCTNCERLFSGTVADDGHVYPVGVGSDGVCGDGEFVQAEEAEP